ncbi:DUF305 domain-containing protein [Arthrobacter sp. 2MCAF14]|uniref:DUF305 domain-containing protein n=1 Tax=Arthrobacter sp. 2MCAF14 TaxID=3232982 RepID=UPI003F911945
MTTVTVATAIALAGCSAGTGGGKGAVAMAQKEGTDGKNPDALKLGKDIVTAQEAEIKEMQELLGAL